MDNVVEKHEELLVAAEPFSWYQELILKGLFGCWVFSENLGSNILEVDK